MKNFIIFFYQVYQDDFFSNRIEFCGLYLIIQYSNLLDFLGEFRWTNSESELSFR